MNQSLGPYRVLRLVDRGTQGRVYLGYDERLQRQVAIKVYALESARADRKRQLHEARVVAGLKNAKIVQVFDVIESPNHLAMVMEYVPGCSLSTFLQHERPSLISALTVGIDSAAALAAAREHKIIHGDLKADNVLISAGGRCKLVDFGIARRVDSSVASAGSLSALAPEQYEGLPASEQSDMYALGVLLYRMLAGVHPFARDGKLSRAAVCAGDFVPLQDIVPPYAPLPETLTSLVNRLLARDPAQRPSNTRIVRQVLREVLRAQPMAAQGALLREARPYFRDDSANDIPLQLPRELLRQGRSWSDWSYALRRFQGRPVWLALAFGSMAIAGLSAFTLQRSLTLPVVNVDVSTVTATAGHAIPPALSEQLLMDNLDKALQEKLGDYELRSGGSDATRVIRARVNHRSNDQSSAETSALNISVKTQCLPDFCVSTVSRREGEELLNARAILLPSDSPAVWGQLIQRTVTDVLP